MKDKNLFLKIIVGVACGIIILTSVITAGKALKEKWSTPETPATEQVQTVSE